MTVDIDLDRHVSHSREVQPHEIFRALGDEVRWNILCQVASTDELAYSAIESTLGLPRSTITYHTKLLINAGCISARKEGRRHFYRLRSEMLRGLIDDLANVAA
ncbi:ArsR/SmtB family transcription factor [Jatrophihabitans sp. DSM 45814]